MLTPEVKKALTSDPLFVGKKDVVLFGLETHVCVLQTALDLLAQGEYNVHVATDAVSSGVRR